ncbi:zf-RVT domain-containing protein [Cephalotus follicularis]|uniref:Zf-RVT domain-containing protein n=1 Tax=Cephalotus follicularis TaxID=3775 RepID=A0A1Q3DKS7_CEPFO|nr:zf-RVT domain-containing protein [Cephalotus follicularis]
MSMQTYWCNTFPLPVSIIKDCERVLRRFLWGGSGRSKVKWAHVCKPQREGGLGIKDLRKWNEVLLVKLIWNVLKEQSLWAKWCHAYLIYRTNFWTLPTGGLLSWTWRRLLLLRPMVKEHFKYICGNGERFSLWYDPWLQGESVQALYGHRVIYDTGLGKLARVKDILSGGEWSWPQTSVDLIELQQRVQPIPISTVPDSISWVKAGEGFTNAIAWQVLRRRDSEVTWHYIVWHPHRIPKHAFILWLTLHGALKTRDSLLAIGIVQNASCVFNCGDTKTAAHLFFQCPFTAKVWTDVLRLCNIGRMVLPWEDEIQWMLAHSKGNHFPGTVLKLAFAASIYHIWLERNRRCFNNRFLPYPEIVRKVKLDVTGRLASGNNAQRCDQHHSLCVNWGIALDDRM